MSKDSRESLVQLLLPAVREGQFYLSSGIKPVYISIDRVWSNPNSLRDIAQPIAEYLSSVAFDKILAVDHNFNEFGAIPIASVISSMTGKPLIIWKEKGMLDYSIYGNLKDGDRVAILYDVTVGGNCLAKAAKDVEKEKGRVTKIVTIVDREEGAMESLKKQGYDLDCLLKLDDLLSALKSRSVTENEQ